MMTEAELWHMQLLAVENTSIGLEGVASIIFAYLAAAYFVGGKLSRFQASVATVFFVVTASLFSFFTFVEYRRSVYFMRELTDHYGVTSIAPNDVIVPIFAIVLALLIPACVYFMYQVRKNAKNGETTG
jgi:hypothetical protein